ncbi:hypothetical protein PVAND_005533 [Polypedilum vanderplanki]|uniref:CRK SH3-binding GNRP n=1 Tax=Polypedilum vanderplanki TaxID=319348 RepID=A0A9J6C1B6_POLVA|nr:hypothetical protein PVAND_005533 [Polypedilum vanderplanki]
MNGQELDSSNSNDIQLSQTILNDDFNESQASVDSRGSSKSNTKLARIRSFKDDFLEKLSQMRTPSSTLTRPHSPRTKKGVHSNIFRDDSKNTNDLEYHIRQVKNTLTHFNDQIQLILGKIIKICDDALVSEEEEDFIALNKEHLNDLVIQLIEGVNNLLDAVNEQKNHQPTNFDINVGTHSRNSLPDITTPKEEKQERNYSSLSRPNQVKRSHSNENILTEAPPLPPKKIQTPKEIVDSSRFLFDEHIDDRQNFLKPNEINKSPDKNSSIGSISSILNDFSFDNLKQPSISSERNIEKLSSSSPLQRNSNESFASQSSILRIKHQHNISHFGFHQDFGTFENLSMTSFKSEEISSRNSSNETPPPLPAKTKRWEHHRSLNDTFEVTDNSTMIVTTSSSSSSLASSIAVSNAGNMMDFGESFLMKKHRTICIDTRKTDDAEKKPPLPPKQKKHIMAYMEIFGNASSPHITNRHSLQPFSHTSKISSMEKVFIDESNSSFWDSDEPKPALPPKKHRINPLITHSPILLEEDDPPSHINEPIENEAQASIDIKSPETLDVQTNEPKEVEIYDDQENEVVLRRKSKISLNLMEEIDINEYLIFKKEDEEGPDIKGGHVDALIVHATKNQKISEAFGEAFLSTFRTFIEVMELVEKLTYRYSYFNRHNNDDRKQKAAKESFSLLVRVVNDLTLPDLTLSLMQKLNDFVFNLITNGEILMAKLLRTKVNEKAMLLKQKRLCQMSNLSSLPVISNPPTLLELKSTDLAEQMTILDAELFEKIEIPEVLLWSQQQIEAMSPNLTLFTAHFNKLSFWARTQILKQQDAKDREKYVSKFIKIMKHLRKINNYNSYLAILSALDSAPIRRLEWQKSTTEGLKEYCALIDSSSSFRAYRQALSETSSPCIPYIGLVLQDLTFVNIGNPDFLDTKTGSINFSKRWQQYSILLNMKNFRNSSYAFKRNEKIIGFFDNFEDYFDEDAMWQISEKIKPRRRN